MSVASVIEWRPEGRRDGRRAPAADTRPEPGVLEQVAASFRSGADEEEIVQDFRLGEAYKPVLQALRERGVDPEKLRRTNVQLAELDMLGGATRFEQSSSLDRDAVWREVERIRKADPQAFGEIAADRATFEREVLTRDGKSYEDDALLARGTGITSFLANLAGGGAASFADPWNIKTLAVGGIGRSAATRILTEGLAQTLIEGAQVPGRIEARAALGKETTARDIAWSIGGAAVGGAAIRGVFEGIGPATGYVGRKVDEAMPLDRRLAKALGKADPAQVSEADIAAAFRGAMPDHLRTGPQADALRVIQRGAEVDGASPYVRTVDAAELHRQRLQEAGNAIERGEVPGSRRGGFSMNRYLQRNRSAESGGNDVAAARTSSAYGRYQFLKDTWVEFYRRTFGDTGESRAAILGKRANGAVQDRVMATFTEANIRILERAGVPVNDGSVYLAHFLGPSDAVKVLRGDPARPLAGLVNADSIKANPAVFGKLASAGDLVAWASRKMGREAQGVPVRADPVTDDLLDAALAAEQADIEAARIRAEGDPAGSGRVEADSAATPDARSDPFAAPEVPELDPAIRQAGVRDAVRPLLDEGGPSLARTDALARELGVDEAELRRALTELAQEGRLRLILPKSERGRVKVGKSRGTEKHSGGKGRAKSRAASERWRDQTNAEIIAANGGVWPGRFGRVAGARSDSDDVLQFVARNGGVSYDGLSAPMRALTKTMDNPPGGHDLRNTGALDQLVPGAGPLLRPNGLGLDEIGERLWEAGYFGPPETVPRPDENAVLDLLQQGAAGKEAGVPVGGQRAGPEAAGDAEWQALRESYITALRDAAAEDFDDAFLAEVPEWLMQDAALEWSDAATLSADMAFENAVRRNSEALQARAYKDTGDESYIPGFDDARDSAGADRSGSAREGGNADEVGRAGESRSAARSEAETDEALAAGDIDAPVLPERVAQAFDDDAGEGAKAAADSDWHDIRAEQAADPNIAARQKQEAQLGAEAPLRGSNKTGQEQDGTIGLGLFDAADAPEFDLGDGKGARSLGDIEAEIEADRAGIAAIRDCLL